MNSINALVNWWKENKSTYLPSLSIFTVWLIFHKLFESALKKLIETGNMWPTHDFGYWGVTALLVSFVIALIYITNAIDKKVRFGTKQTLIYYTFGVIYLIYRSCNFNDWSYVEINQLPILAFSDLLLLIPISVCVIEIVNEQRQNRKVNIDTNGFLTDIPIILNDKDPSGRYKAAINLKDLISKTNSPEHSFAIAINGNWGSGKTSFLRTIENELTDDVIKFWFNPWNKTTKLDLTELFLDELKKNISVFDKSLTSLITDYTNAVVKSVDNKLVKTAKDILDIVASTGSTIENKREQINNAIKKNGKKIIVFIDDVDRLDKKEIFEVLRLIRNVADFSNVFFICAFDRPYVISAIELLSDYNKEHFLEKIFQFELSLPPYPPEFLSSFLHKELRQILSEDAAIDFNELLNDGALISSMRKFENIFQTPRDCVRYINQYHYWGGKIEKNVYFPHLYFLLFLSVKYPTLINLFYRRYSDIFIVGGEKNDFYYKYSNTLNSYRFKNENLSLRYTKENSKENNDLALYIILVNEHKNIGISEDAINEIISCSHILFEQVGATYASEYRNRELRINSSSSFFRYFLEVEILGDISSTEYNSLLSTNLETFCKKIDLWCTNPIQASQLFEHFVFNNFNAYLENIEAYKKHIKAFIYYHNHPKNPYKHTNRRGLTEYNEINLEQQIYKLALYSTETNEFLIKKLFGDNKIAHKEYVTSVFNSSIAPNDFLEDAIILMLRRELFEIIEKEDLVNHLKNKLERLVQNSWSLDIAIYSLYQNIIHQEFDFYANAAISISEQNSAINDFFKNLVIQKDNLSYYLTLCINYSSEYNKYSIDKWLKITFNSYDSFIAIIKKYNSIETIEFVQFYEKIVSEKQRGEIEETFVDFTFINIKPYRYNWMKAISLKS